MNDNALLAIIISAIQTGLTAQSITVGIQQAYQPTTEGVPSSPTILIHKVDDDRYGWVERNDIVNLGTVVTVTHTEIEKLITSYEIGAIAQVDPSNVSALTAADYVKAVARVLQSEACILSLQALNIGTDRIQRIKTTYFRDDKGQNETYPNFIITFVHDDVLSSTINSTTTVIPGIYPI